MGYMDVLASAYGTTLEYEDATVIAPAVPELGREAKVEREWVEFEGFMGRPYIPEGETDPAKTFPNLATLHTTEEIPVEKLLRWDGRTYRIVNYHPDASYGLGMMRYELRATINAD